MNIISYNEIHLVGVKTDDVNWYLRELRTFFEKEQISQDYSIIVHDDVIACCGARSPREISIELQGPENSRLKVWLLKYILRSIRSAKVEALNSADANLKVSRY